MRSAGKYALLIALSLSSSAFSQKPGCLLDFANLNDLESHQDMVDVTYRRLWQRVGFKAITREQAIALDSNDPFLEGPHVPRELAGLQELLKELKRMIEQTNGRISADPSALGRSLQTMVAERTGAHEALQKAERWNLQVTVPVPLTNGIISPSGDWLVTSVPDSANEINVTHLVFKQSSRQKLPDLTTNGNYTLSANGDWLITEKLIINGPDTYMGVQLIPFKDGKIDATRAIDITQNDGGTFGTGLHGWWRTPDPNKVLTRTNSDIFVVDIAKKNTTALRTSELTSDGFKPSGVGYLPSLKTNYFWGPGKEPGEFQLKLGTIGEFGIVSGVATIARWKYEGSKGLHEKITFSADGKRLMHYSPGNGTEIGLVEIRGNTTALPSEIIKINAWGTASATFSADGNRVAAFYTDGTGSGWISWYDLKTKTWTTDSRGRFKSNPPPLFHPDGSHFFNAQGAETRVQVLEEPIR